MLSIDLIAKELSIKLSSDDLLYNITPYLQQWYNYSITDSDDISYVAGNIRELDIPLINDYRTTRTITYVVNLKAERKHLEKVKQDIVNINNTTIGDYTINVSDLYIENILQNDNNGKKTQEFIGNFRLQIAIPTFIIGKDVKVKIDDQDVIVLNASGLFEKALIMNKQYGDNYSDINIGQEFTLQFGLDNNEKTQELFADILSSKYNKECEITFNFISVELKAKYILRSGTINWGANNSVLSFSATFEKALPRTNLTINDYNVSAIGFTPQLAVNPTPRVDNNITKIRGLTVSKTFNFYLENDKSQLINDILMEFQNFNNKKFTIKYTINGVEMIEECILMSVSIPSSENPFAVFNITMGVGAFD